jgi:hypothetical protein
MVMGSVLASLSEGLSLAAAAGLSVPLFLLGKAFGHTRWYYLTR